MTAIAKVTRSYQVTIPSAIRKKTGITIGTLLGFELRDDGIILLTPQRVVPANQEWFWTKEWQAGEAK